MRNSSTFVLIPILLMGLVVVTSCGHSAVEIATIVSERDSLRQVTENQNHRLETFTEILNVVNANLDSIATQEDQLFVNLNTDIENQPLTKDQLLNKVNSLDDLIQRQKKKIANLEDSIKTHKSRYNGDDNMIEIITTLKRQLAQKDVQIANLREVLAQKDFDIQALQETTTRQLNTINQLTLRNEQQQDALKRQDAALNLGYVAIGTKKELQSKGIIRKERIVAQNALDRSKFSKVDIRRFTEMSFSAKRPKILTSMPESAYELITDGNKNFTLRITNPTAFWSISNYLVIQTD